MLSKIKKVLLIILARVYSEHKKYIIFREFLGITFGEKVRITGFPDFGSEPFLITIGNNVTIAHGATFHNHDGGVGILRSKYPGIDVIKPITIGNNVFIGSHVTILPGVVIGNNVIIAASSVVTKNVPDNVVFGGVPGKVIKTLEEYEKKSLNDAIYLKNRFNKKLRKEELVQIFKEKALVSASADTGLKEGA